jgi:hypothetical protein
MCTPGISTLAVRYECILLIIVYDALASLRHGVSLLGVQGLESKLVDQTCM